MANSGPGREDSKGKGRLVGHFQEEFDSCMAIEDAMRTNTSSESFIGVNW
jgi:hypothetical protein